MATRCLSRSCLHLSSPASSFLQLAPKRHLHSSVPLFDFLAPRLRATTGRPADGVCSQPWANLGTGTRAKERRGFTTTSRKLDTRAIVNSAKDDDGKDMLIDITPRAANRLKQIMEKDSNPNLALRISVESGGCHGFQYLLSLSSLPPLPGSIPLESSPAPNTSSSDPNATPPSSSKPLESSPALNTSSADPNAAITSSTSSGNKGEQEARLEEDDVVFAEETSGAKVVIDVASLELLKGSKVEFTTSLMGTQFAVINPNSTSNCGCGTSFDIKI